MTAALFACTLMQGAFAFAGASDVSGVGKQASPLTVALTVKKVVGTQGEERRVDASRAAPGDVLEYRAEYKNVGKATLTALSAILPLPEHTTLLVNSPYPADPEASIRSARNQFSPLSQNHKTGIASRTEAAKEKTAPRNHYGALRWNIAKLAPGESFAVSARVLVDSVVSKDSPNVPLTIPAGLSTLQ